jgi:spermidine/putrescine-binding protein
VFSSREHTRALGASDVWAAVGWSGNLVPQAERSADVALVAPASGTALWADVWTVPTHAMHGSRVRLLNSSMSSLPRTWSAQARFGSGPL